MRNNLKNLLLVPALMAIASAFVVSCSDDDGGWHGNKFDRLTAGSVIYADDGKTPIAITVYQSGGHGYAIALTDATPNNTSPSVTAHGYYIDGERLKFYWSDILRTNCTRDNSTELPLAEALASTADDAKTWTNFLADGSCGHVHYAAQAARNYNVAIPSDAPEGTQWVLPSIGMWAEFYNQSHTGHTISNPVENIWTSGDIEEFDKISDFWTGKCPSFTMMKVGEYSSSSECRLTYYYCTVFESDSNPEYTTFNFGIASRQKASTDLVRPFLVF